VPDRINSETGPVKLKVIRTKNEKSEWRLENTKKGKDGQNKKISLEGRGGGTLGEGKRNFLATHLARG